MFYASKAFLLSNFHFMFKTTPFDLQYLSDRTSLADCVNNWA